MKEAKTSLGIICAAVAQFAGAAAYYSVQTDEIRDWSHAAAWKGLDSGLSLPDSTTEVGLNSSKLSTESPLVISTDAAAKTFTMGNLDSGFANFTEGLVIAPNGKLTVANAAYIGDKANCPSQLKLSQGSFQTVTLMVGNSEGGYGEILNNGGTVKVTSYCHLGYGTGSQGGYIQSGGSFDVWDLFVGRGGTGAFSISDSGTGLVRSDLQIGLGAVGVVTVASGSKLREKNLSIGNSSAEGCYGRLVIEANATNEFDSAAVVGAVGTANGRGEIVLRGGVLMHATTANPSLKIGNAATDASEGTVRGWGFFYGSAGSALNNSFRIANDGKIIADGEGVARTLDLSRVVNATNRFPNGATGTHGWYAVNKGLLQYPRGYISANPKRYAVGEYSSEAENQVDLVNSLYLTFGTVAATPTVRTDLYAADREDYPQGLPEGQKNLGVWAIWLQQNHSTPTRVGFTDASVKIRYDHTRVNAGEVLKLWRYRNGEWKCLVREEVEEGRAPYISVDGQEADTGATIPAVSDGLKPNVGWYALTCGKKVGTIVIIR